MERVGRNLSLRYSEIVTSFMEELKVDYHTAVNKAILDFRFAVADDEERAHFYGLQIFPGPESVRPIPRQGCLPVPYSPASPYIALRESIVLNLVLAEECFLMVLQTFYKDMDVSNTLLVNPQIFILPRPLGVDDFRIMQDEYTRDIADNFRAVWIMRVLGLIDEVVPSGANLLDAPKQRLLSVVSRLSLLMSEQLQHVVMQSVEVFKRIWMDYFVARESKDEEIKPLPIGVRKDPLFRIKLLLDYDHFEFLPKLEAVENTIQSLLEGIVESVKGMDDLQTRLTDIFKHYQPKEMTTINIDDKKVTGTWSVIQDILHQSFVQPKSLLDRFMAFKDLAATDVLSKITDWKAGNHSLEQYEEEVTRYQEVADAALRSSERETSFELFVVNCETLCNDLSAKARSIADHLLTQIMEATTVKNGETRTKYEAIETVMLGPIDNAEQLDKMRAYMLESKDPLYKLKDEVENTKKVWAMLQRKSFDVPDYHSEFYWITVGWPQRIALAINATETRLAQQRVLFINDLMRQTKELKADIKVLAVECQDFMKLGDIEAVEERTVYLGEIEEKLKQCFEKQELFNSREAIFDLMITEFPELDALNAEFENCALIWHTAWDFLKVLPAWMDGPFSNLDAEEVQNNVEMWYKNSAKCCKVLTNESKIVAEETKRRVEKFQENVPMICALRNPGMRDRHYKMLSERLGFEVRSTPSFTVNAARDLELQKYMPILDEVSEFSTKEYGVEQNLDKMQGAWTGVKFEYAAWRGTGTHILRGVDDLQMMLEEHLVKTQSMQTSPYIGPFEDRVKLWLVKLNLVQECLDEWLKCQQAWMYLEPIFTSEDIMQQMPVEGRRFKAVDASWRKIMEKLIKNPEVLIAGADEELLNTFKENNKQLDNVNKGLNDYLETKRLAFPRFYFLSNDELLEILAETKDPLRVQPFCRKIFEGINRLVFEPNLDIVAMLSEEGERVDFIFHFNPKTAQGAVEKWLIEVEDAMRTSLQDVCRRAFEAYAISDRIQWIIDWPGQIVLCVSQMYWTQEVTESIRKGTLGVYEQKCTTQLQAVVSKVRGQLTSLERKTICALIVIDVHARDVVKELADASVSDETDFDWICQLRYAYEEGIVMVRMINAAIAYFYEYLGNSSRLVITPLTDRCYRTLMGALHLNLGGAPEGPAGTGKTETTKDLAKAIAMQCVVFNCSDGLDYLAMGKFFKGLASSGAWACFDEFNRIDLEVLSVIAQQILTIQRAKAAHLKQFDFEGTKISLKPTCSVFITMNPGYAGRSELPDNLKALFRSVAMMVPDYALISEITLYSFGYLQARELARKLVATYRLCSEQLSSQNHYDYGMRAVISVLRAAGAVKQKYPKEKEDVLMLKSLKDVNLPKFLAHDIPLFEGILMDLFPGVSLPPPDYEVMEKHVRFNCEKFNLQPTPVFLEKIYQLYEMILVRHGLMLVGYSYGAKTECYRVLAAALTDMKAANENEQITKCYIVNPKSIYIGQLYGQFDPVSHEWTDGVLAKQFRIAAVEQTPDRKWIIFDGPVDAVWIENMNTVLDDNKKLCLMSGEIIQMSPPMNLIFEVQDLAVASPATVSRCGMVYVEPSQIGWRPLKTSWLRMMKETYSQIGDNMPMVDSMTEWLVDPCIDVVKKYCKEPVPTSPINLAKSFMNLYESLLDEFKTPVVKVKRGSQVSSAVEYEGLPAPKGDDAVVWLQGLFVMALIWSIGASIDGDGRAKFNLFLHKLLAKEDNLGLELSAGMVVKKPEFQFVALLPEIGSCYDFTFVKAEMTWKNWLEVSDRRGPLPDAQYNEIVVTTIDVARYSILLVLLVTHHKHVLFGGPTGTGKTVYVKHQLTQGLDKNLFRNIMMTFSAQTNANQTQDIIDTKLDKRRKQVYGPPVGSRCVVFVDDLNMPSLETYGAQPPIEILRQWMDHGGWYDREENCFRQIVDIQFVTAMGPPGGGRNPVTPRYLRHFNLLYIIDFDDASLTTVFDTIIEWWVRKCRMPHEMNVNGKLLVATTIDIYRAIQRELLPTPAKSHYTYNMRDVSKVFQGLSQVNAVPDKKALIRLWCHEALRVFHDRLVNDEDRTWFMEYMQGKVEEKLTVKCDYVFGVEGGVKEINQALKLLAYGDIMDQTSVPRKYEEIPDQEKLLAAMNEGLKEFNAQTRNPMALVLFTYAASHVLRIGRIIRQPFGNALLVGFGGVGRQSLTKLATFMAGFNLFQVQISKLYGAVEWEDDLKLVLKKAGADNVPTVFLFNDTQIKMERFLEDINNILNTGEVPNLHAKDEIMAIFEVIRPRAKKAGRDGSTLEMYMFFVEQCRKNLHMVIAMSPFGDAFRTRLRMFPSLVNCCTIDWFSEWPAEALKSVATNFIATIDLDSETTQKSIVDMCMMFHLDAQNLSHQFFQEAQRHFYITPTSYLELLGTYKDLLTRKRHEIDTMKHRYSGGLQKLYGAEEQVSVMKQELEALQPVLLKTAEDTNALLKKIAADRKEAETTRALVEKEEAVANVKAIEAKEIKDDCESELAVAMPMLESALAALDTLTKADITEVKAMKNPPKPVKIVMEACCIMKEVKSKRIPDPNKPGAKIEDFWGPAQQMLADTQFLPSLKDFDKDNINPKIIEKIRPYLLLPEFVPEVVQKASKAAYGLCCWVRAMESYDRVAKVVAPKKAKLAAAEAEFKELQTALAAKKAMLQEVQAKLQKLQEKLDIMEGKKALLEAEVNNCQKKLGRAEKLIGGLGGEKVRWNSVGDELGKVYINLTGDVLLASGYIAYLGPVTLSYREHLLKKWGATCNERNIPSSPTFKLATVLGSPVTIRDWVIDGLPNDSFSIDNGIIIHNSRRWPLLIDPQGQANKWIKTMQKKNNLQVMKLSDGDFVRKLENCITFGYPLLLENVMEELDPTLEPLLARAVFKSAGSLQIRLGDSVIEYNDKFRFYITTKMRNPHYAPEISVKISLLNFMITPEGLEDQLLGMAVKNERPDLEEEKTQLVVQGAENQRQLKDIEDRIIQILSSSEGNILEDETAIEIISSSKVLSVEIAEKQKVAVKTEARIDEARKGYIPVAVHVASLFFTTADLCCIDPMYQYSLTWYMGLFFNAMRDSEKSTTLATRLETLNTFFTYLLYCNISRSLFEKDKMLLSFLICATIWLKQGKILHEEFSFFVIGGLTLSGEQAKNPVNWLADKLWTEMIILSSLPNFGGFSDDFSKNPNQWKPLYESPTPYRANFPGKWEKLNIFQKLLVVKIFRPEKVVESVNDFVFAAMGQKYMDPPQFDLSLAYPDSSNITPLVFVLSAGSDPMATLLKFAEGMKQNVNTVSLGQGQGPKAAEMIDKGTRTGDWVVLQNCHLAASWMQHLERIAENINPEHANITFRLWLTSYPSDQFPVSILQNSVKMTNESPKGLRANMLLSYQSYPLSDPKFFGQVTGDKGAVWRKMVFGLAFFHASVQERLKYGPLGWNIPYQFSDPDLKISIRQLQSFLIEYPDSIQFKALIYLTGECNYGGKVTDAHDRRTLMSILHVFYCPSILDDDYRFSPSGTYYAPPDGKFQDYIDFIKEFPLQAKPECFGLHENADITKDQQESNLLLHSVQATMANTGSSGGRSRDEVILEVAADIAAKLPGQFDVDMARLKYPVKYEESMNSVLHQEMIRYNKLTDVIRSSLVVVQKTLKGLVVMSSEIEKLATSMFLGRMPAMWAPFSYPTMKPLLSYAAELYERLKMLRDWMTNGAPPKFWISGFFFTHAFLTGVLQNYARKHRIPIDTVGWNFKCMPKGGNYDKKPEDGCYIYGMSLEGARWDDNDMSLAESDPKVLFSPAPLIWLQPCVVADKKKFPCYSCPLYRTTERRGVLATTGHSSNFVINIDLPSEKSQDHWIRRGVAMLLTLSD
ncbi:dynein axonemal heavy chain [Marchantia polymorpha subsp. ruderalis]|nr:hypothetical protein MARPO_0043s0089 [Marchantia polymorpha]BBM97612.1 hypothetical protein Mp_1g06980 [Marchantia polymorpha subsp. ruderalis]|eukprot:PTQ39853.1 hypothetical protein MARPO_0043s0089 [Marchantia polymorpha]